ncbi:unnamed protein product, partial [Ectocarpus sp. 12 AP-2014]
PGQSNRHHHVQHQLREHDGAREISPIHGPWLSQIFRKLYPLVVNRRVLELKTFLPSSGETYVCRSYQDVFAYRVATSSHVTTLRRVEIRSHRSWRIFVCTCIRKRHRHRSSFIVSTLF